MTDDPQFSRRDVLQQGGMTVLAAFTAAMAGCKNTPKGTPYKDRPVTPPDRPAPPAKDTPARAQADPDSVFERARRFRTLQHGDFVPEFVMCPPTKLKLISNNEVKHWQWLTEAIQGLGGQVVKMEGGKPNTGYGEIWTRDPVLAFPKEKIFFRGEGYKAVGRKIGEEAKEIAKELKAKGFREVVIPHPSVDGGEVIVDAPRKTVFIGYEGNLNSDHNYYRTDTARIMKQVTGYDIQWVQRDRGTTALAKDANFYHLDCGMGRLPDGKYLVSESAITPTSMRDLEDRLGRDLIVVRDKTGPDAHRLGKTALGMGYNLVGIGRSLIMPYCSPELKHTLQREHGYVVVTPKELGLPDRCWNFNDGGPHCSTHETKKPMHWSSQKIYLGESQERGVFSER